MEGTLKSKHRNSAGRGQSFTINQSLVDRGLMLRVVFLPPSQARVFTLQFRALSRIYLVSCRIMFSDSLMHNLMTIPDKGPPWKESDMYVVQSY